MALEPNDQVGVAVAMLSLDVNPQKTIGLVAQIFNAGVGELAHGFHQMSVTQIG
jgi:hypothetical protein